MHRKQTNKTFIYGISLIVTLGGFLFGYDTAVNNYYRTLPLISCIEQYVVRNYGFRCTSGVCSGKCFRRLLQPAVRT